jgi:hypothetical protein
MKETISSKKDRIKLKGNGVRIMISLEPKEVKAWWMKK